MRAQAPIRNLQRSFRRDFDFVPVLQRISSAARAATVLEWPTLNFGSILQSGVAVVHDLASVEGGSTFFQCSETDSQMNMFWGRSLLQAAGWALHW